MTGEAGYRPGKFIMKRYLLLLLSILTALSLCLSACGNESGGTPSVTDTAPVADTDKPADTTGDDEISGPTFPPELSYDYDLSEYITLPEHSALRLDVTLLTVRESDIDEVVENALASAGTSVEVTDRPAREGDTVTYDVSGTRKENGKEFDRGSNRTVVIGSEAFLAGFAEHLIGARPGDRLEFEYTYPDDYFTWDLAGVTANFTVTVKSIAVVTPAELNDGFVRSLGIEGVTDVAGYREHIRSVMQLNADAENEQILRDAVYDLLDKGSAVIKYPEKEWKYYSDICIKTADSYASGNNISREAYILQTYGSYDAFDAYVKGYCEDNVKRDLISYSLAREYGVTVDPAEYERELLFGYERFAASYGFKTLSDFERAFSADLSSGLLLAAGLNAVAENATVD